MSERETILAGLRPLFEQARREGKWFWCSYQDLWFTPDQLEAEHRKGSFIWGAVNWRLRDPREKLAEEERIAKAYAAAAAATRATIEAKTGPCANPVQGYDKQGNRDGCANCGYTLFSHEAGGGR